ncbi:TPA: hypothetical protein NHV36_004522 [Klebsiella michiganensis]|uniref:hypothetical protein n=2 Tax=Klebsiella michiganensis TaxID=1134687 RepID=UPI0013A53C7A|nr:hypothetical protein [Klebsiella michiganensis]QLX18543.1 hypothetical protein HV230_28720 [Klebsiella oxytoca]HCE8859300.1 hypothetical protein [Klebsiella michiganensis]HCE9045544.1 hypothetical protein [Klebsiella michiganensis]HCE9079666.1 hypothetical protein [Klebsiella michiganensis]HDX8632012.1 hypothetical protein [Klebsiella michiganensis]
MTFRLKNAFTASIALSVTAIVRPPFCKRGFQLSGNYSVIQEIQSMPFEWKDVISPVATVTAVWLGARLALNNDIRKKALELETERMERLAVECHSCLSNLNIYCMNLAKLLHDLSGGYEKAIMLADVTDGLTKSAAAGTRIDFQAVTAFQNTLEFHRPADFEEWKETILKLVLHLEQVIAAPSLATVDCTVELSRQRWEPGQTEKYNQKLAELASPLPRYRQQLIAHIAGDYRALLHPASPNIRVMTRRACRAMREFVR